MRPWMTMVLGVGFASCLNTSGYRVGFDSGPDPGIDALVDAEVGEVGGKDRLEGVDGVVTPEEAVEVAEAVGVEVWAEEGLVLDPGWEAEATPADGEAWEVQDLADGAGCQVDEDCLGVVGPLDPCRVAVCIQGECGTAQAPTGTPCAGDGNACTEDQCDDAGACVHEPITCLDPPENTCDGDTLVTWASPGRCNGGQCEYTKIEKQCANGCTSEGGVAHCGGEDPCAGVDCTTAPSPCLKVPGVCDQGSCVFEYDDGAACEDGDACSVGDRCAQGVCLGERVVCDAPPEPVCQDANTLVTYAVPGTCVSGECEYGETLVSCEHGCEVGRDGKAQCVGQGPCEGVDCSTAPSPCLKAPGVCVGGACVFGYDDGAPCEDGNHCTSNDRCEGGECVSGEPKVCDDGDPCTDDSCDPESGECVVAFNEAPCDDGLACTTNDRCSAGKCGGDPVVCDRAPEPECEDLEHVKTWEPEGTCVEPGGTCVYGYTVSECPSGWCQYGYCTSEGMTVVGFFEAGGGVLDGGGLSLGGTFGGWTEGGSCQDGEFVLGAGW